MINFYSTYKYYSKFYAKGKEYKQKRAFKLRHQENKAYKNTKGHLSFNSTTFKFCYKWLVFKVKSILVKK